jgi:holliday junction DNA helicase RuvA
MVEFLKGIVKSIDPDSFVIDLGSIGLEIISSKKTLSGLAVGCESNIYTHLAVKEDGMQLFGFISKDERHIFRMLISVSGIGPKAAVSILSAFTPGELAMNIIREDEEALTNVKGIGKKTAGRIILELKDKMKKLSGGMDVSILDNANKHISSNEIGEAFSALIVLGYAERDIRNVVSDVYKDGMTVEEILREALKKM